MYVPSMMWQTCLLTILLVTITSAMKHITVTDSNCGQSYDVDDDDLMIYYKGNSIQKTCTLTFLAKESTYRLCVKATTIDMPCSMKLTYNAIFYSEGFPNKEYDCNTYYQEEWCTSFDTAIVTFKVDEYDSLSIQNYDTNVQFKVYTDRAFGEEFAETVQTTVYVIIGVVVGVIILVVLCVVIVVCCVCKNCCRNRQSSGTVYRAPQQATAITVQGATTYPQSQPVNQPAAGYQPPPAGYQQPPPAGYQQPPPTAYGQGYQPPPQQGYNAGNQGYGAGYPPPAQSYPPQPMGNLPEKSVQPSAPPAGDYPMTDMPPPYPGI